MIISVINHSNGMVTDAQIHAAIRGINRQIQEDFAPYWGMSAAMRLEGRSATEPDKIDVADMRGDAVIYLWDKSDVKDAIGYHNANNRGIPYGFVFLDVAARIGENWTVTLSHEALELIADPECNLLVLGPHPDDHRDVFHWFEMCDAVQAETYVIDGIEVSNFLLPLYFTGTRDFDEVGARNDFLGTVAPDGTTLRSFGINQGGYIGFFDPSTGNHETFMVAGDQEAPDRLLAKQQIAEARRSIRQRLAGVRASVKSIERAAGAPPAAKAAASPMLGMKPTAVRKFVPVPPAVLPVVMQPQAPPLDE
jgi:hypothetical protein